MPFEERNPKIRFLPMHSRLMRGEHTFARHFLCPAALEVAAGPGEHIFVHHFLRRDALEAACAPHIFCFSLGQGKGTVILAMFATILRSSRLFGVGQRSFTQCLWKGQGHQSNIMFQCDSHYRCCACTAAVLKCYGLVVQSPPPKGGTVTTLGGDCKWGVR